MRLLSPGHLAAVRASAGAALDLYGERGFEQTTVAEIADRAGLTERTFFRLADESQPATRSA
jgi:tetracycline repressor-like protein